jgi:NADH:ubiquinone oxidoreductase subunit
MGVSLGTRLYTWLRGEKVGRDQFGNRYYRNRSRRGLHPESMRRERRWVVYEGQVEASRVPPEWHAWLHHTVAEPPKPGDFATLPWMKEHRPNLTGTPQAYRPPGHTLKGGHRAPASGDYEAWTPE